MTAVVQSSNRSSRWGDHPRVPRCTPESSASPAHVNLLRDGFEETSMPSSVARSAKTMAPSVRDTTYTVIIEVARFPPPARGLRLLSSPSTPIGRATAPAQARKPQRPPPQVGDEDRSAMGGPPPENGEDDVVPHFVPLERRPVDAQRIRSQRCWGRAGTTAPPLWGRPALSLLLGRPPKWFSPLREPKTTKPNDKAPFRCRRAC